MNRRAALTACGLVVLADHTACTQSKGDSAASGGSAGSAGPAGAAGHAGTASLSGAGAPAAGAAGKAPAPSLWPGWERLPKFPEECQVHRPIDIAAEVPKLTWSAVPDAPGWVSLDTPWMYFYADLFAVDPVGDIVATNEQWPAWRATAAYRYSDGAPQAVFRFPPEVTCFTLRGDYGRVVGTFYWGEKGAPYDHGLLWSTPADLAAADDFRGKYLESAVGSMSDRQVAPTGLVWSNMLRLDFETGVVAPIPRPPNLVLPRVQHTDVVMIDKTTQGRVVAHADGTWEVWPPSIRGIATDGKVITWLQGDAVSPVGTNDPEFSYCELWTSPYAKTFAELQPKKVARVPTCELTRLSTEAGCPRLADGMVAHRYVNLVFEVHRLSDGVRFDLPKVLPESLQQIPGNANPTPNQIGSVLAVSQTEVIVAIGKGGSAWKAVRIPLSTLPSSPPP